jgi:hypothetical protein
VVSVRAIVAAVLVLAATAALVYAQDIILGGRRGAQPRWAEGQDFDGSFMYCRGYYSSFRNTGSGSGWNTDYPAADNNFSVRLGELTRVPIKLDHDRQPHHVVVSLTDPLLYRCPLLFMEDVGSAEFSNEEVQRLREFFMKGGFLWVDDSWGTIDWSTWVRQLTRILPPGEFPIVDIPTSHPIMRSLYEVKEIPQVPSINHWYRSRGLTSERGIDSSEVYFKGVFDERGHLMVVMTHNTDISDTWEREGDNAEYFDLFSPRGYAIGVNIVLYAMTH